MLPLNILGNVPFGLGVLSSVFPDTMHIGEKARRLEGSGQIIRLKKGLYVASPAESGRSISRSLVANHIYGPSYVSLCTALRHYGLIPERVNLVQSVTTKHARCFANALGNFDYCNCGSEYFPIGVRYESEDGVNYLIASPEKALCDLVNYSKGVSLRFVKDAAAYMEEDIRFDTNVIPGLDTAILEQCAPFSRKPQSIATLIKYIKHEQRI